MLDDKLLSILVCPEDRGRLLLVDDEFLYNPRLRRAYRIDDGIPVLLVDEATTVMAMGRLNDVWDQLFPVERHRIANLMIERIDLVHIGEVQGIKVKWRELGWDADVVRERAGAYRAPGGAAFRANGPADR